MSDKPKCVDCQDTRLIYVGCTLCEQKVLHPTCDSRYIKCLNPIHAPYPQWCIGAPTVADCIKLGYCTRNCGG